MKFILKRFFFLTLMLLTAVILTSCGDSESVGPNIDFGDEGDLVRDEEGNIVYSNVKLKVWSVTTGDDAAVQDQIVSEFNKLYKGMIEVEVVHHSRYDMEQLLGNAMNFDKESAPDMLFTHGMRATEYASNNWLYSLDKIFEKAGTPFDKTDYAESLIQSVTINNEAYGVPIDCHSVMMEVRKDILDKNNLQIPTNYQELVEVCEAAIEKARNGQLWIRGENSMGVSAVEWRLASTAEEYTPFPISYGDMWVHEFFGYTAAIQNGGVVVDGTTQYPGWNTAETAKGLQVVRDWVFPTSTSLNKNALSKNYGSSYDVGDEPFRNGSAIFKLQGPWAYQKDLDEFDRSLGKDGGSANITTRNISNMLALDSSKEYASKIKGEGHALMLLSTVTSQTKACASTVFMDYMAYFSGLEWAKRGHIPAVQSVATSSDYVNSEEYKQYIKYWGQPSDYVVVQPTKYFSYVDTYFKNSLQKTMNKDYQSQAISSILQKEYDDCLAYIELYS